MKKFILFFFIFIVLNTFAITITCKDLKKGIKVDIGFKDPLKEFHGYIVINDFNDTLNFEAILVLDGLGKTAPIRSYCSSDTNITMQYAQGNIYIDLNKKPEDNNFAPPHNLIAILKRN